MITINNLSIDSNANNILVNVSAVTGSHINKVLVWKAENFKDPLKSVDVTQLLTGLTNNETFSITKVLLGVDSICGVWFVEFFSDLVPVATTCLEETVILGTVSNLIKYHECSLNSTLAMEFDGCKLKEDKCESGCKPSPLIISTLLTSLDFVIKRGLIKEINEIIKELDNLCEICNTCPSLGDTELLSGMGHQTVNNITSLI